MRQNKEKGESVCTCFSRQLDGAGGGRRSRRRTGTVEPRAASLGRPSTTDGALPAGAWPPLVDDLHTRGEIPWLRPAPRRDPSRGDAHISASSGRYNASSWSSGPPPSRTCSDSSSADPPPQPSGRHAGSCPSSGVTARRRVPGLDARSRPAVGRRSREPARHGCPVWAGCRPVASGLCPACGPAWPS